MERWWERQLSSACQSAGKDKNKQTSNPVSCTSPPGSRGKGWGGGKHQAAQEHLGVFEKTLLWYGYGGDQRAFLINYHLINRSRTGPISMSRRFTSDVVSFCCLLLTESDFFLNFFNGQNILVIHDNTQICLELFHMCILGKSFEETFWKGWPLPK